MKRRRQLIVLNELALKSAAELAWMVAELSGVAATKRGDAPSWSKRFVASGKANGRKCRS